MRLLLDTHVLLWALSDLPRLNKSVIRLIADRTNEVFLSAASVWEISIKNASGKLKFTDDLEQVAAKRGFAGLPISLAHARTAGVLPPHHRDPFDRMLVAQAMIEGLTLITDDQRIPRYEIRVIKAG